MISRARPQAGGRARTPCSKGFPKGTRITFVRAPPSALPLALGFGIPERPGCYGFLAHQRGRLRQPVRAGAALRQPGQLQQRPHVLAVRQPRGRRAPRATTSSPAASSSRRSPRWRSVATRRCSRCPRQAGNIRGGSRRGFSLSRTRYKREVGSFGARLPFSLVCILRSALSASWRQTR